MNNDIYRLTGLYCYSIEPSSLSMSPQRRTYLHNTHMLILPRDGYIRLLIVSWVMSVWLSACCSIDEAVVCSHHTMVSKANRSSAYIKPANLRCMVVSYYFFVPAYKVLIRPQKGSQFIWPQTRHCQVKVV